LWNLTHGFRPEISWLTTNGVRAPGEDLRIPGAIGYVSAFTLVQSWLPLILMTPLYAVHPYPPMHIFALQIIFVVIGFPGVYWASKKLGATRNMALVIVILFSLLPQVDSQIFFKSYLEQIGIAFLPWFFGAIYTKNWKLTYFFGILLCLISIPYSQFIVICGISLVIFYRARLQGLALVITGLIFVKINSVLLNNLVSPYYALGDTPPLTVTQRYVLNRTIESLIPAAEHQIFYVLALLCALPFIGTLYYPLGLKWRRYLMLLGSILFGTFLMSLFRTYGWEHQRNALFLIPILFMALASYIHILKYFKKYFPRNEFIISCIFLAGLLSSIYIGTPYGKESPLASHFPWHARGAIAKSKDTLEWIKTFKELNLVISQDSAIAYYASPNIEALLNNRRNSWPMQNAPDGVEYYIFIGNPESENDALKWDAAKIKMERSNDYINAISKKQGQPLVIFKNLRAHSIAREESLLGWSVFTGK
jgi:uncharacterized membrane protein